MPDAATVIRARFSHKTSSGKQRKDMTRRADNYMLYSQVENIVNNYAGIVNRFDPQNLIEDRFHLIKELKDLLAVLRAQEREFFSALEIRNGNDFRNVNNKLKIWNNSNANCLFSPTVIDDVFKLFVDIAQDQDVLNNLSIYVDDAINKNLIQGDNNIAKMLNTMFAFDGKKFSERPNSGLNGQVEIRKDSDGKYKVILKQSKNELSFYMKTRLIEALNNYNNNTSTQLQLQNLEYSIKSLNQVRELIIDQILKPRIPNKTVLSYIEYELYNRSKESYAIYKNEASIQGWLGEVYGNAFLNYLLGDKITTPTGNIKSIIEQRKGKSLSIDTIVMSYGFQIKSWNNSFNNNSSTKTFHETRGLGNFLENNVSLTTSSDIGKAIAEMFGAASYNKPNIEYGADTVNPNGRHANQSYEDFYHSQFGNPGPDPHVFGRLSELNNIFSLRIHKIANIDIGELIKTNNATEVYRNTFWIINDNLIPSSVIIQNLIDTLEEGNNTANRLITFKIDGIDEQKKEPVWPTSTNYTNLAMANRWRIAYTLTFNLNKIFANSVKSVTKNGGWNY